MVYLSISAIVSAVVAVLLGAGIIEKHFILDSSIGGVDAAFSKDEIEFAKMVEEDRNTEKAIDKVNYKFNKKINKSKIFER